MSRTARFIWAPHPYQAGFCITDDTDAATLESVKIVYDFLSAVGLRTSKTVWAFGPSEPCGIPALPESIQRGITCEDRRYLYSCQTLRERGFEICLHGASAGNNRRARTIAALEFLERHFGPAGTYVCHAKNAENLYWHEKVAPRGPAQWLLGLGSRYRCSGEDPASPYFWGDVCLEKVQHIRLFRTRNVNTLAENPSMPYHDPEKPWVRSWFSATKRSFKDCTTPEALEQLRGEHGLCVLYQYMHRHAYLERGTVTAGLREGAERLMAAGDIWVDTTSAVMARLRAMQGIFMARRKNLLWVGNANEFEVGGVQLSLPGGVGITSTDPGVVQEGNRLRIAAVRAGELVPLRSTEPIRIEGGRVLDLDERERGALRFPSGRILVNAAPRRWEDENGGGLEGGRCRAEFEGESNVKGFSRAGIRELYRLLSGQLAILGREVLFKGRSLDTGKFLGEKEILLEDHDAW
ncbi:MAG: hypothetical protein E6K73_03440 [Candidatus Eisenbacteria bacterium]|uniref:Uncharacterized protein n=1 Tax=Eiseniibacteriota bacterium TaxID=2212470 RepID=A0A538SLH5_UNCEI|nr:MAG: hypothetical protein E6K73_03440 [Candidatus Eisenbacteria bacterium]